MRPEKRNDSHTTVYGVDKELKLTKSMWNDFLEMAVDSAGESGWKWFENKYGLNRESFENLLINNQEDAEKWKNFSSNFIGVDFRRIIQITVKEADKDTKIYDLWEENKQLIEKLEKIEKWYNKIPLNDSHLYGNTRKEFEKILDEKH